MRLTREKARVAVYSLGHKRLTSTNIIRVVKIKSGTAEWPIRVKLKTIDCRTSKYTALSYAYETDVETRPNDLLEKSNAGTGRGHMETYAILCNGNPLRVTKSLWEVLDQLRRLNSDVPIWIDRLCINFDSREERAAQVNMMSHIYGNASHVIVWLGKKTKTTGETILCMRKLVNAIDWRRIPRGFAADFRDPITYTRFGMDRISVQQWNNIYLFCHATWFSRLWAFYELASAKQAIFLIGDSFVDYDFILDFAMILGLTGWLEQLSQMASLGYNEDMTSLTKMLGPVANLRAIPHWHPRHPDHAGWMKDEYGLNTEVERAWQFFELMLQNTEGFRCRDERDRIFAPLAYMKKIFAGTALEKSWPIVDYGTSEELVYSHFANIIQDHTYRPSILASPLQSPH